MIWSGMPLSGTFAEGNSQDDAGRDWPIAPKAAEILEWPSSLPPNGNHSNDPTATGMLPTMREVGRKPRRTLLPSNCFGT